MASPAFPVILGSVNITNVKDVVLEGNYAHVAAYTTGFRVVDISDRTRPKIVSQSNAFVPRDVAISGNLALYSEQLFPNAIPYVNIREPFNAVFQGTIDMSSLGDYAGTGIYIDQQFVYITAENSVVSSDFGSSGSTVLMIAQYRQIEDNQGIPPEVELLTPTDGQSFIQGESVLATARARDDIYVAEVQLLVDGEVASSDRGEPYEIYHPIPANFTGSLSLAVRAIDLGGNHAQSPTRTFNVTIDPKTTAIGRVIDPDGNGIEGATVSCLGLSGTSDVDGGFSVSDVPSVADFSCSMEVEIDNNRFTGISSAVTPVRGGVTDVGEIRMSTEVIYEQINFTTVNQLYCNGTCTWAGSHSCDQADADIFCKLKTGNPLSVATSFSVATALPERGFSCPNHGGPASVNFGPLPQFGVLRDVWYQDSSILANHGSGAVIVEPECTSPSPAN